MHSEPLPAGAAQRLQRLEDRIAAFEKAVEQGNTPRPSYRERKTALVEMLLELAQLTPPELIGWRHRGLDWRANLLALVQEEGAATGDARQQCVGALADNMQRMRSRVQTKLKGVMPEQPHAVLGPGYQPAQYIKGVDDFLGRVLADGYDKTTKPVLARYPKLIEHAGDCRHMLGLLQLCDQLDGIAKEQSERGMTPNDSRDKLSLALGQYAQTKPKKQVRLEITDRIDQLSRAETPQELAEHSQVLRIYAVNFCRYHLKQVAAAWAEDANHLHDQHGAAEAAAITAQRTRTLDHVYQARWALVNDRLKGLVDRYAATLANPKVPAELDAPYADMLARYARGLPQSGRG